MDTGYHIRHVPTGNVMRTPYQTMTEALLALTMAAPVSASEYDVIAVAECAHPAPDLLSPCCYHPMRAEEGHCPYCHEPCEPEKWCLDCDTELPRAAD